MCVWVLPGALWYLGLDKYLGSSRLLSKTRQDCNCPLRDPLRRERYICQDRLADTEPDPQLCSWP
jgi:hypothetical protein